VGLKENGLATLHVHHIERNPDGMDEHDKENLTVLCRPCHSWLHQQSTPTDSPVKITDADQSVTVTADIEILRVLADDGPARTGEIAAELTANLSVSSVRERLWVDGGSTTWSDHVTGRSSIRTSRRANGG